MDEGVDRGRGEGVSPHQQGVEAEDLSQVGVLHEAGDDIIDAAVRLEPDELGSDPDHAPEVEEGHVGQLLVALAEHVLGVAQEAVVAVDVGRVLPGDLLVEEPEVVRVVEAVAVFPVEPIEGRDRQQLHVVSHRAPAGLEQLLEAVGSGDDGRASVEGEALVLVHVGSSPGAISLLDERGADAGGLEPDGEGEPPEPAADHRGGWSLRGHLRFSLSFRMRRPPGLPLW
jgi:hypothetical protein